MSELSKWDGVGKLVKIRIYHISTIFSNFIWFKSNLKTVKFWAKCFSLFFGNGLSDWCKWYGIGKLWKMRNFFVLKCFSNCLRFKNEFKYVQIWFRTRFFLKFVEMRQIIYGWKDIENTKLSHVERFIKVANVEV